MINPSKTTIKLRLNNELSKLKSKIDTINKVH